MQDLSLHILDIVENSIRAEADRVDIVITEDEEQDLLTILIRDNGRGMDEETVRRVLDPFTTTRTTRRVGLGLPLLAESARQSGGDITVESEPDRGTTVRAHFRHGHIDRAPVGDMAGTLTALIAGNPGTDFIYTHIVDGATFTLDTRETRRKLGDDALTDPRVIGRLKQRVATSVDRLRKR